MKRIVLVLILLSNWLLLSGCGDSGEINLDSKMIEMESILTTGGFHVELLGAAKTFEFYKEAINDKYDLDLEVYQIYIGTQEGYDDVYMIVFWETDEATAYEEAYLEQPDLEDRIVYREGQIVIVTYSEEAIDLFQ